MRGKALLSLLLLVPAPSLGVLAGMVWWPDTAMGKAIFAASKVWLFGLPAVWYLLAERGKVSLSPARKGGFGFGVISGLAISAVIAAAYFWLGERFLDEATLAQKIRGVGLDNWAAYIAGAAYWICINSVLEEYVWRWFVVRQCGRLVGPVAAAALSAALFTVHHIFAMNVYMPPVTTAICAAGIFIGGATWSWMYIRYESIWPGYVSHAIVDLCVFAIGAKMIFG